MKKYIFLAILSGLLMWIAWPPTSYTTFLLFVGLVPMLLLLEEIMQSNSNRKGFLIFWLSFLGFFIWNTLSVYWVYNSVKTIGALVAVPISMVPYSLGPLLMSTACWLYYRLRKVAPLHWSLAGLVCFWIGYEYLHQSWDLAFPWMTLGNGFAISHSWIQWYEFTGVYGGTIWIWLVNILIFLIYLNLKKQGQKKHRQRLVTALVLAIILPLSFSLLTYYQYKEQEDPANIVVVQPNIDPYQKDGTIPTSDQINTLIKLSQSVAQPNTEFFIWPETAIMDGKGVDEDQIRSSNYYEQVQHFLYPYKNANVLTGIESYKLYSHDPTPSSSQIPGYNIFIDHFNAAVNIENSARVQFYHKSKLVPGVEQMPFGSALSFLKPVFEHLGGSTGGYGKQDEPSVFYSQAGMGVAPVICYESIWGEYVGKYVLKGAQFIAIITNDGWWENTSGKDQHLDYAKLRAIETRRWVCRSANTGLSAFINQRGDLVQQTKWWVPAAIKQDINLNSDLTFYVKHGDYLAKIASFIASLIIIFLLVKNILFKAQ
ncbi:MAG: apolipoprotein N-acyltransferase [Janthinobacterium lividum]